MRQKLLKKVISILCVGAMSMSCLVSSVGAVGNTKEAEVAFNLKYLEAFPREGSEEFKKFSGPVNISGLKLSREEKIKHSNLEGSNSIKLSEYLTSTEFERYKKFFMKYSNKNDECVNINEKEVYAQIESKVRELEKRLTIRHLEVRWRKKLEK